MAGQCEEDVIEIWRMHGQAVDLDLFVVELLEQGPQRLDTAVRGDLQCQGIVIARHLAEDAGGCRQPGGVRELEPDVAAGNETLELVRGSFGNQSPMRGDPRLVVVASGARSSQLEARSAFQWGVTWLTTLERAARAAWVMPRLIFELEGSSGRFRLADYQRSRNVAIFFMREFG
jgi:hypothetical protein